MLLSSFSQRIRALRSLSLLLILATAGAAFAQVPDAGSLLREQLKTAPKLPEHKVPAIERAERVQQVAPAEQGPRFVVSSIGIDGNSVFPEPELLALVEDVVGQSVGLAELNAAAARISQHYRSRGYIVARAYLPAQDIVDGAVRIAVIEGRFGEITLYNTSHVLGSLARDRLDGLSGEVVESASLQRALLLLDDMPGVGNVHATLLPGARSGETDVSIDLEKEPFLSGSIEADNFGNRYVGANQVTAKLRLASPYRLGEAWGVQYTRSDDDMTFQRLSYQRPLGSDGGELGAGYIASRYRLGEQFSVLDASGDSKSWMLSASYPFVRSGNFSLYGRALQAWRDFEDRTLGGSIVDEKSSVATTLMLNGSRFDDAWGGGGTTFALAWTSGDLDIESTISRLIDDATARTHGNFDKWNLQLLRVQNLGERMSAYLSFTGQMADSNLDSSEKFILGGPTAVRAYPQGEAPGDSGYIATAELRYRMESGSIPGALQPFVFVDAGSVTASESPFAAGPNHRRLAGGGVGVAWFGPGDVAVKLSVAHRLGDEPALSDDDESTRVWAQVGWSF